MFKTLLIANRGEIACRIIGTARKLGVRTVAVYSEADAGAMHVRLADEAAPIGPPPAAESYLNAKAILDAARRCGAEAIHPGYGFLSENADFAEAVAAAGMAFVGPPADAIRAMGAKDAAKRLMEEAGVPVVPGCHDENATTERLREAAGQIGYPVLLKAAFGGGGRGMRRIDTPEEFKTAFDGASREAKAAFGDARMIVEKLIASPRHIEVQIFGDSHGNIVHLFERDCSLQRRHQKVIEEAPAPGMTDRLRRNMTDAAIAAARAVNYAGAGTIEFIVDGSEPLGDETSFYFMEMNTRLQVEHPVTEMITGLDLVEWQLRVAAGETLPCTQDEIELSGHAVEGRLYAENPETGFLPSTGPIRVFAPLRGEGIRFDAGVETGDEVSGHYDAMIAKAIAHGPTRGDALSRLDAALEGTLLAGPDTNQAFLRLLLAEPDFVAGRMDTGLIGRRLDDYIETLGEVPAPLLAVGVMVLAAGEESACRDPQPWAANDGFQLGAPRRYALDIEVGSEVRSVEIEWRDGEAQLAADAATRAENGPLPVIVAADGGVIVVGGGRQIRLRGVDPFAAAAGADAGDGELRAPMPGLVASIAVSEGDLVETGAILLVLEAMKMEHAVRAPFSGTVRDLTLRAGDRVAQGDALAVIEAPA